MGAFSPGSEGLTSVSNAQECASNGNARSTLTAAPCCNTTGPDCVCTKTYETSTQPQSQLTLFAGDSPANPSLSPGKGSKTKTRDGSGRKWPALLGYYDPDTSSWRTFQGFEGAGSVLSRETWPLSGMTRSGTLWQLPRLPRLTFDNVSSLLPTPVTCNYGSNVGGANGRTGKVRHSLTQMARNGLLGLWPTPSARLGTARGPQAERYFNPQRSNDLDDAVAAMGDSGPLNPQWVAWLLGFQIDWLSSVPWETPSSRKSRKQSEG